MKSADDSGVLTLSFRGDLSLEFKKNRNQGRGSLDSGSVGVEGLASGLIGFAVIEDGGTMAARSQLSCR